MASEALWTSDSFIDFRSPMISYVNYDVTQSLANNNDLQYLELDNNCGTSSNKSDSVFRLIR
jgi:hypothetical protein